MARHTVKTKEWISEVSNLFTNPTLPNYHVGKHQALAEEALFPKAGNVNLPFYKSISKCCYVIFIMNDL